MQTYHFIGFFQPFKNIIILRFIEDYAHVGLWVDGFVARTLESCIPCVRCKLPAINRLAGCPRRGVPLCCSHWGTEKAHSGARLENVRRHRRRKLSLPPVGIHCYAPLGSISTAACYRTIHPLIFTVLHWRTCPLSSSKPRL